MAPDLWDFVPGAFHKQLEFAAAVGQADAVYPDGYHDAYPPYQPTR